jgi:hypothetical protein
MKRVAIQLPGDNIEIYEMGIDTILTILCLPRLVVGDIFLCNVVLFEGYF